MKYVLTAICFLGLSATSAVAADKEDLPRKAIECVPAKGMVKAAGKVNELDADRRDTIDTFISGGFKIDEGQAMPDRLFFKDEDGETPFTIAADGKVSDFGKIGGMSKKGEFCLEDQGRAGKLKSEDGLSFSMDMTIRFKNLTGTHTVAEILDGVDDGKSHYKKIVGGAKAILVPKMTHVLITPKDKSLLLTISATKDGAPLDNLLIEPFGKTFVVGTENLQDIGADMLLISGGPYMLEPVPSIEKMKSLGFGPSDVKDQDGN